MGKSKIEWTDYTWSPIVGCSKISEGCKNCYAYAMSVRFHDTWYGKHGGQDPLSPFAVRFIPQRLEMPMTVKKPSKFFVCSMGDLFHEDVKEEWILKVLTVIRSAGMSRGHKFMILTKRPANMVRVLNKCCDKMPLPTCLWLGVSAENQHWLTERVPFLGELPKWADGKTRTFVSVEPMLGPVHISVSYSELIRWAICGGETGTGHRAFDDYWGHELLQDCRSFGIPFFFKKNYYGHCELIGMKAPQEFPCDLSPEELK